MTTAIPTVFVVDDDPGVLKALTRLLRLAGFEACAFNSSQSFLEGHDPATPGCAVLDIAMPGLNGIEVQRALTVSGSHRPVIFVTGRGDIPTSVRAMKAGAVDFLTKPVMDKDLLAAVRNAVEVDRVARAAEMELQSMRDRLATLTPRECEVLTHVVAGQLNKQIAADLGTVEKTIKVHRARVMEKMGVRSLADLVRVAQRLGISTATSTLPR